ncbi:MAG: cation diffusion facilitator family transporter [Candidatus Velthaea sp.]
MEATDRKQSVALSSVMASAGLTVAKLAVGLLTGSLAILSEAAHSLLDLGAAAITWMAVRQSDKPADADHQWGHGKIEAISALIETALLFVTALGIAREAVLRLVFPSSHPVVVTWYAVAVVVTAILVDITRSRALMKVAKETRSQALEADALHFSSDILASASVLVGLAGVALGYPRADALAALAVSLVVIKVGWRLGSRTIDVLVDAAPDGVSESITEILQNVPAIARVERVRARLAGSTIVADALVCVAPGTPIENAAAICDAARDAVTAKHPEVDLTIGADPLPLDQGSIADTVRHVAARLGYSVHDISVYHTHADADITHVGFDVELDGTTTLADAHGRADEVERAVALQLGGDVVVRSHLDPKRADPIDARLLGPDRERELIERIRRAAAGEPLCRSMAEASVQGGEDGFSISVSCTFDRDLSLNTVHAATWSIEQRIRHAVPEAGRVIVHAEPAAPLLAGFSDRPAADPPAISR